jgi:hypothetical protein
MATHACRMTSPSPSIPLHAVIRDGHAASMRTAPRQRTASAAMASAMRDTALCAFTSFRIYFFSFPKDFPITLVVHFTCVPTSHLFCIPGCCFPCAAEAIACRCVRSMRVLNVKQAQHAESCCANSGHARTEPIRNRLCDLGSCTHFLAPECSV